MSSTPGVRSPAPGVRALSAEALSAEALLLLPEQLMLPAARPRITRSLSRAAASSMSDQQITYVTAIVAGAVDLRRAC